MEELFAYLAQLEQHNDREWYRAHKAQRDAANGAFEELLRQLIFEIGKFDPVVLPLAGDVKALIFKMVRDTRFGNDKTPYNPAFRAHIGPMGKLPIPVGYYVVLRRGGRSFLGGGLFADMFTGATARIRDAIAQNGQEFETIITAPGFADTFAIKGEKLKRVPAGYDAGHPQAEYLKYKSWYLEYPLAGKQVEDTKGFLAVAGELFEKMKPFNDFLNRALKDFTMPTR